MKAIISLTVPEGKRLIAKAVVHLPEVKRARETGKILLKGGTTVSAIAQELVGAPLRISGRVTPRRTAVGAGPVRRSPHDAGARIALVQGG